MRLARLHLRERASVLIVVLWITFGLVSIALYFGHSMFFELRASDNSVAGLEAEQALEGAARYVSYFLTNMVETGLAQADKLPDPRFYDCAEVPLGDSTFWLIGRADLSNLAVQNPEPYFGLTDEASKLNLNTATLEMLQALPGMTENLAAAIIDWRDSDDDVTEYGAEVETYALRNPSYQCKNSRFETVEELRLVYGATPEILCGEDYNRNGILDPNENDADLSPPNDNRDGKLDPGLLEYLTVWSREPNTRTNGSARINVNTSGDTNLTQVLEEKFGQERATQIQQQTQARVGRFTSVLEYYLRSGMTAQEFAQTEGDLTVTNATLIEGLVNVNTASAAVLACIPGIGPEYAQQLVAARQTGSKDLTSSGWVKDVLDEESLIQAGPYLTSHTYQFTADIAAVGHHGRGYRRALFIFDTSEGAPKLIYRRDLTRLGWALGLEARERSRSPELAQQIRRFQR